jgi:hypothetical protein
MVQLGALQRVGCRLLGRGGTLLLLLRVLLKQAHTLTLKESLTLSQA